MGTPAQRLRFLIDISSPDTFVTAQNCTCCCPGTNLFDASNSSTIDTYQSRIGLDLWWIHAQGNLTRDTFTLGSLKLDNQSFVNAGVIRYMGSSFDDYCVVSGILGLTPTGAGSSSNTSSIFEDMAESYILDANIFSLRLRRPYELAFGTTNPNLYKGEFNYISVTSKTSPLLRGRCKHRHPIFSSAVDLVSATT